MTDLVGIIEIADRLGVTRGRVDQWRTRGQLPEPTTMISRRPVWDWKTVEEWAQATGRLPLVQVDEAGWETVEWERGDVTITARLTPQSGPAEAADHWQGEVAILTEAGTESEMADGSRLELRQWVDDIARQHGARI